MTVIKLDDLPEPGVIYSPASFARWAEFFLNEAETQEAEIAALEAHKNHPLSDALLDELDAKVNASLRSIDATILFSALEVEATLNFHGVVLLGNDYFDRNLERLSPPQKLSAIVAICERYLIERHDEIHCVVERLFAARNKVAHPKTKGFRDWESVKESASATVATAREAVSDMKTFIRLFKQILPHSLHSDCREDDHEAPAS